MPKVTERLAVEQGATLRWERHVGDRGRVIGMNTFGASAPLKELQRKFRFEPECIVAAATERLTRRSNTRSDDAPKIAPQVDTMA